MSKAMELIVQVYVRHQNRRALEDLRKHRQKKLALELRTTTSACQPVRSTKRSRRLKPDWSVWSSPLKWPEVEDHPGRPSPALSMKRSTEAALRMQAGLLGSQFFDQHLDPIDRELIRDRRCYSFVMLDFFIELDALVAHWGNSASLKVTNPRGRD